MLEQLLGFVLILFFLFLITVVTKPIIAIFGKLSGIPSKKEVIEGNKNAIVLLKYLQGINSFQAGNGARLELFPDKVVITQHKVSTVSFPYSQIIEVSEEYVQQMIQTTDYDYIRDESHLVNKLETSPCLVIRYLSEEGKEKRMIFQMLGGIEDFTFFRQVFQQKIASKPSVL